MNIVTATTEEVLSQYLGVGRSEETSVDRMKGTCGGEAKAMDGCV